MAPPPSYRRRADAVGADLGDELAVLDMQSGSYIGFNATAAAVWRLLEQPRTPQAICAALRAQFDVEEERCRSNVERLLERLLAHRLIERSDG